MPVAFCRRKVECIRQIALRILDPIFGDPRVCAGALPSAMFQNRSWASGGINAAQIASQRPRGRCTSHSDREENTDGLQLRKDQLDGVQLCCSKHSENEEG